MSSVDPIGHQHRQLDILITMVMLGTMSGENRGEPVFSVMVAGWPVGFVKSPVELGK